MNLNLKSLFGFHQNEPNSRIAGRQNKSGRLPVSANILIVDDSRTVIAVLNKTLTSAGYNVISALNAEEGIDMAKLFVPDLILMDIIMPGINGFQATRILRKEPLTKHIPIVVISGNEQATEKYWAIRVGADGFLSKPIDRDALFTIIRKYILRAKVLDNGSNSSRN